MNEEYRGFKLYGGCDSRLNHSNGGISELTRFTFPMNCDDEDVAKLFGLEIGRLLLDSSFRVFSDSPGMKAKSG
jgi:hypothetical protein